MTAILPILPEILLLALGILVLIIDPFLKKDGSRRPFLGWFTAVGLLVTLALSLFWVARQTHYLFMAGCCVSTGWALPSSCSSSSPLE